MIIKFNRRHFLKTSSGLMLAVPFLGSLDKAQAQTPAAKMKFISVQSEQGAYNDQFFPSPVGAPTILAPFGKAYDLTKYTGAISPIFHAGFNRYKANSLLVNGLYAQANYRGHNGAWMLGAFNKEMGTVTPPLQPTIDQIISLKSYERAFDSFNCFVNRFEGVKGLRGSVWTPSGDSTVRVFGPWSPKLNFEKYFKDFAAGGTAGRNAVLDRRALVVDRAFDAYKSFVSKGTLAASDRTVLDQHMEHLFEIESKINQQKASVCAPPSIALDPAGYSCYDPGDRQNIVRLNIDIAIAALRCDLIRVANFVWDEQSSAAPRSPHNLHHEVETPEQRAATLMIDTWHSNNLLYLLGRLETVLDTDGKPMFANSLVAFGKEMSDGNSHTVDKTQTALFGGAGGKLKMGQYIDFNTGDGRLGLAYNRLLMSIMMAYGLTPSQWELPGQTGYGMYVKRSYNYNPMTDHLINSGRRDPLPGVMAG